MKRLNPETGQPYKRGDIRDDGYVFNNYTRITKKNGFFKEVWLKPQIFAKTKESDRNKKNIAYKRTTNRLPKGTRRYFSRDYLAREAYKAAMKLMLEDPNCSGEDIWSCVDVAPHVLKIIFPDQKGANYHAIFQEGEEVLKHLSESKKMWKVSADWKRKQKKRKEKIYTSD